MTDEYHPTHVTSNVIEKEIQGMMDTPVPPIEDTCLDEEYLENSCNFEPEIDENEQSDEEDDKESSLDQDDCDHADDEKIYPGHCLPLKISVLIIWLFAVTHSISVTQFANLLGLLNLHFLVPNINFKSFYRFKKYFGDLGDLVKRHYYCNFCLAEIDSDMHVCPNSGCLKDLTCKNAKGYFLELDVFAQVRNLFSQPDFIRGLEKKSRRQKKNANNYEDIYDGNVYKQLAENGGPLSDKYPYNISFTVNTDGVPIFKSSKISIWPVYLMVNELPFYQRRQSQNMILCGLWIGSSKPFMAYFTAPLHECLKEAERGFMVKVNNEERLICCFIICLAADLPARAAALNMNQFNGDSCCTRCLQRGENLRTASGGNIHIFPFMEEDPFGPPRLHNDTINDALHALANKQPVRGIKGPSCFLALPGFDFVKSTSLDYMHCILLGVTRLFTKLWFTASFRDEEFSLYEYLFIIDKRIMDIKPPKFIVRVPRSISEHLRFWKAAEYRSWLFYYSIPILNDLMKPCYLFHYMTLVEAVFILCKDSISEDELCHAEQLLVYFVFMVKSLYGERYQTMNVHSLLHLPAVVKDLGPLWAHSCFAFENANGCLTNSFHGTQHIDLQIANAVNILQSIPQLAVLVSKGSNAELYVNRLTGRHKSSGQGQSRNATVLGLPYDKPISNHLLELLEICIGRSPGRIGFYKRIAIDRQVFHSIANTRVKSRNSYTCKFYDQTMAYKFGFIQWFSRDDQDIVCCIEQLLICDQPFVEVNTLNVSVPHIHQVSPTNCFVIIPVKNLVCMCVCVSSNDKTFICEVPNDKEINI